MNQSKENWIDQFEVERETLSGGAMFVFLTEKEKPLKGPYHIIEKDDKTILYYKGIEMCAIAYHAFLGDKGKIRECLENVRQRHQEKWISTLPVIYPENLTKHQFLLPKKSYFKFWKGNEFTVKGKWLNHLVVEINDYNLFKP